MGVFTEMENTIDQFSLETLLKERIINSNLSEQIEDATDDNAEHNKEMNVKNTDNSTQNMNTEIRYKNTLSPKTIDKSNLKVARFKTIYMCPITECIFSTDKAGMYEGSAAKHVSSVHGVKNNDIINNPGKYKFKKIKKYA